MGLDATSLGEPIYSKQGFKIGCPIVRWRTVSQGPAISLQSLQQGMHEGIFVLDTGWLVF